MLGIGLMLESHLAEVEKRIDGPTLLGSKAAASVSSLSELESSCYICSRIDRNLSAMNATAVYLWESDLDFRKKFEKAPYFCLPHYRRMIDYAQKKMNKIGSMKVKNVSEEVMDIFEMTGFADILVIE